MSTKMTACHEYDGMRPSHKQFGLLCVDATFILPIEDRPHVIHRYNVSYADSYLRPFITEGVSAISPQTVAPPQAPVVLFSTPCLSGFLKITSMASSINAKGMARSITPSHPSRTPFLRRTSSLLVVGRLGGQAHFTLIVRITHNLL